MAIAPVTLNDTQAISKVNAAIGKANLVDGKADRAEVTAGLNAEAAARAVEISALPLPAPVHTRPGDAVDQFTTSLAGGDPGALPAVDPSLVKIDDAGRVVRLRGDAQLTSRAMYPVEPSRRYLVQFAVQRRVNSPDPDNDAIRCALAWYDQARTLTTQTVVQDLLGITTGSGRQVVSVVVSRAAGDEVDVVAPPSARYCRPYVQTFGTLVQSDVEVIRWEDITDAAAYSPDLTALEGQVAALESVDAGDRLAALEMQVTSPNQLRLPTRADLVAETVAVSVDQVVVLGEDAPNDGGFATYQRTTSVDGEFQSADGAYWRIVEEVSRSYETIDRVEAKAIPSGVRTIRVEGRSTVGGTDAGTFIDADNGSQDTFSSGGDTARTWYRAFDTVTQRNPNSPGWNVSFNPPDAPGYSNGMARTYILDENSDNPVNGWLLNLIVEDSYNKDVVGNITSSPVAVGINVGMQVQKENGGNDFWPLLGVLDIQADGTAGQATSGIIRGNWTGTNIAAGLRAQGENYTGRAGYGLIVSASLTDGTGSYFDNSFANGVFVHMAKDFGVRVGGPQGAQSALLPDKPFVFQTADGLQDIWSILNNDGLTATMRLQGAFVLESGSLPLFQIGNVGAAADQKYWQMFGAADGTFQIRTLNDPQTFAETCLQINRSGASFISISFGDGAATVDNDGYVNALTGIRVAGNKVLGGRDTGWTAMTGSADRSSVLDVATVTLTQLAARVHALQTALTTHGSIGA